MPSLTLTATEAAIIFVLLAALFALGVWALCNARADQRRLAEQAREIVWLRQGQGWRVAILTPAAQGKRSPNADSRYLVPPPFMGSEVWFTVEQMRDAAKRHQGIARTGIHYSNNLSKAYD